MTLELRLSALELATRVPCLSGVEEIVDAAEKILLWLKKDEPSTQGQKCCADEEPKVFVPSCSSGREQRLSVLKHSIPEMRKDLSTMQDVYALACPAGASDDELRRLRNKIAEFEKLIDVAERAVASLEKKFVG
ncbi:hypothetical protein AA101099_1797 [Neoasaia chiangmaiensis NBRC 101099]|uniref:Uncharacterized protein n=1 Tax=Neoasaia chiangmaiensis TaxID=320497 RepID=A0A1U9KR74_9PROT|nr:hypothetical protein [Neoasaia chiangmaiensis]AQS88247.1 hypothetical protein A0U93_10190 [Neoasaia chiangmaiensis]GBR39741.1 hypothetical protein AA101099_1797 [Neoasaia chiangmaiensis NBRC 101099]GEN14720.1 hypothetical protein NCH01_11510 [Neoasaia chiangmaiensis]